MVLKHGVFFVLLLMLLSQCSPEIHRAKVHKQKSVNSLKNRGDYEHRSHDSKIRTNTLQDTEKQYDLKTWIASLTASVTVGLSGIFPMFVISRYGSIYSDGAAWFNLLLSFAVGGLLGDVFLHLLPEAWVHVHKNDRGHSGHLWVGGWVLFGLLFFFIVEKAVPTAAEGIEAAKDVTSPSIADDANSHHNLRHRKQNGTSVPERKTEGPAVTTIKTSGWLNLFGNVIDNFTHGLAVGGSFVTGVTTTFAILLHEVPHEIGDFAILLRSGFNTWQAAKAQLFTASGVLVGTLTALLADSATEAGEYTAWILPFSAGGFLYIALVTVVPDLVKETCPRQSTKQICSLLLGIAAMHWVTYV